MKYSLQGPTLVCQAKSAVAVLRLQCVRNIQEMEDEHTYHSTDVAGRSYVFRTSAEAALPILHSIFGGGGIQGEIVSSFANMNCYVAHTVDTQGTHNGLGLAPR